MPHAELNGHPNKWQVFINPAWVVVEPIDIPATVDNLLENAIKDAVDAAISFLPDWLQDIVWSILSPIIDGILNALDIATDVAEWLSDLLGNLFGLLGIIETAVADYFASPPNDPRVLGLRLTRQVDVTGVLRVPNSNVWRLQWTETERSTQPGGLTRTLAWEGYVTVRLVPPRTVDAVQDNPLGLAVTSVNWTQVGASTSAGPVAGADTTLDQGVKP